MVLSDHGVGAAQMRWGSAASSLMRHAACARAAVGCAVHRRLRSGEASSHRPRGSRAAAPGPVTRCQPCVASTEVGAVPAIGSVGGRPRRRWTAHSVRVR